MSFSIGKLKIILLNSISFLTENISYILHDNNNKYCIWNNVSHYIDKILSPMYNLKHRIKGCASLYFVGYVDDLNPNPTNVIMCYD